MAMRLFRLLQDRGVSVELPGHGRVKFILDGEFWITAAAHYGTETVEETVVTVSERIRRMSAEDLYFLAWAALRHMGDAAPTMDQVVRLTLAEILPLRGPLAEALRRGLPDPKGGAVGPAARLVAGAGRFLGRLFTRWSPSNGAGTSGA